MAVPARKLDTRRDWLTVDQAAELTGESVRTWRWRAKQEHDAAMREGRESLAVRVRPDSGKGVWHVARSIDRRLTAAQDADTADEQARPKLLTRYARHTVELAYRRLHWLNKWRKRCDRNTDAKSNGRDLAALVVREARTIEGDAFKISVRSLMRWSQAVRRTGTDGQPAGVEALIDRRTTPGVATGEDAPTARDPAAVEYFYSLYRTENKLAARLCHEATVSQARRAGWRWPATYSATTAWLRAHDDRSLTFLLRHGKDRWARKYLPHIETDEDAISAGELYVCDHHECDWWVVYKGKQIRPWLTAVQDRRSRCVVGWHLGPAPHSDAIVASMRMAFRDWGIPRSMRIDNGRDYTSKMVTGVTKAQRYQLRKLFGREWKRALIRNSEQAEAIDSRWLGITGELGIELIYAVPYAPWAKGTLERWFGTLEGRHGKTYVTYCGNSALEKPECLEEIRRGYTDADRRRLKKQYGDEWKRHAVLRLVDQRDIPTLEESRTRVGEWIELYHRTEHTGNGMHGATPLAVWATATVVRKALADDLMCLMDTRGIYTATANGVRVTVGGAPIGYGAKSKALKRYVGRDVLVTVDPDDISHCWAFTAERDKREPIGRLDANERIAPATHADEAREAIAEIMRERKTMHKARRASAKRTRTATARMREHHRAQLDERRKTGTDDVTVDAPRIVPVATGFEGASKPDRSGFDAEEFEPIEPGELEDLFDEPDTIGADDDDWEEGMEALFDDDGLTDDDADDDGLESLL